MPCNCDHLEPNSREKESVRVMKFLREVGLHTGKVSLYGDVNSLDEHTAALCKFCQNHDVKDYSLELQIWWRDHQKADTERLKKEYEKVRAGHDAEAALAKLTAYERELLGV